MASEPVFPQTPKERLLGVERVGLDQHTVQVKFAEQLPEHRPLVVLTGGIAGLADGHSQGGRVQRHLGNERRAATRRGSIEPRSVLPSHTS